MELTIRNFGPIKDAQIDFGDLTFLIGPQASGKSLSLELLKLIIDRQHIISTLRNYNYILNKKMQPTFWKDTSEKDCRSCSKRKLKYIGAMKTFHPKNC